MNPCPGPPPPIDQLSAVSLLLYVRAVTDYEYVALTVTQLNYHPDGETRMQMQVRRPGREVLFNGPLFALYRSYYQRSAPTRPLLLALKRCLFGRVARKNLDSDPGLSSLPHREHSTSFS